MKENNLRGIGMNIPWIFPNTTIKIVWVGWPRLFKIKVIK